MPAEQAFGRLKARFRMLNRVHIWKPTPLADIVSAACILHNLFMSMNSIYDEIWDSNIASQPITEPLVDGWDDHLSGAIARDVLCAYGHRIRNETE